MNKYITTYVDGVDIMHINLWKSPTDKKTIVAKCVHNEIVILIDRQEDQSKVKTLSGKEGWCNTAFLTDTPNEIPQNANSVAYVHQPNKSVSFLSRFFSRKK